MKKKIKTKTIRVIDFVKSRPIVRLVKVAACLMLTISSHAASIVWMESGTDATGGVEFYSSTSGTVATDSTVSRTGPRSLKNSTGAGATLAFATRAGVCADAGRRISVWFRFDTLPAADASTIFNLIDGGSTSRAYVGINTAGTTTISINGVSNKSGTRVLAVNTWYRITLSYTITDVNTFQFRTYINGVLEVTQTAGGPLGSATLTGLMLRLSAGWGANRNVWYDNVLIDDGADYTDPGNILVTAKKPAGNNVNQYDTAVGNNPANRWENVEEVPLSIVNGWQQLAIADTQENYTLQTRAVGDVDISAFPIVGRLAWIWAKETAVAGTPKIMDNGTETGITLTTSPALYTVVSTDGVYPSNAAGIGMRSAVTAVGTFLYECGTLIAYTAPVTPNAMMSFFFK